jgi:membrane protease YdiL (CAAX protease family)
MKVGTIAVLIGSLLLGFGVFMLGDRSGRITGSALVLGLLLLSFGVARLVWAGWHGSASAWIVAAPPAAILTWTLYELVRQGVPLYGIGIFGEMTAPILSSAVGIGIVVMGRLGGGRSTREIGEAD